ncbi:MAG: metallophosphoesterase [Culicoidibacterales bacterium]
MLKYKKQGKKAIMVGAAVALFSQYSLPTIQAFAAEVTENTELDNLKVAVLSDPHYFPSALVTNTENEQYQNYMAKELYLLKEADEIFVAALKQAASGNPDILLIPGDVTKNGEVIGTQEVAYLLNEFEKATGIDVFVVNGNHDLYSGAFAFNGPNGDKQAVEHVSYEAYQEQYANFGYQDEQQQFQTVYFGDNPDEVNATIHPELSYVARPKAGYVILALNSQLFTTDANGQIKMNGAGFNEDLLQWAEQQIKEAEANGETVIAMMHQGLLPHALSSELAVGDAIINNYEEVATRLADAGLRYVFTGHMHENDIAEFTTPTGNTIYDIETAATPSYGSPVRTVEFTKQETKKAGEETIKETVHVRSESVKATENIADLQTYIYDSIYKDSQYLQIKLGGALESLVNSLAEINLYELIFGAADVNDVIAHASQTSEDVAALATYAQTHIAPLIEEQDTPAFFTEMTASLAQAFDGKQIKTAEYGKLTFKYDAKTQVMTALDSANNVRAEFTLEAFIKDIVKKIDEQVLDAGVLNGEIQNLITNILNITVFESSAGEDKTLQDVLNLFLIDHFLGAEDLSGWAQELLDQLQTGEGISELIDNVIGSLLELIPTLLNKVEVDVTTLTTDKFLQLAINMLLGKDKSLYNALDKLGINLVDVIKQPLDEYLGAYITPSFEKQMGVLIGDLIYGLAGDDTQDDAIDGAARILTYEGVQPQAPSISNGLLPHSVAVTFGADETTQKAFSWYTGKNVPTNEIQFVKANEVVTQANGEIDFTHATSINADSEIVKRSFPTIDLGIIAITKDKEVARHQVVIDGLQPGTTYYYRVGDATTGIFTDTATFETAQTNDDAFTFLNFADTQSMLESEYEQWGAIVEEAFSLYPEAKFATHAGDMVDNGKNELQWQWFLNKPQADLMNTSIVTASGNHEDSGEAHTKHFNIQDLPVQDLETGAYYKVDYGNVLVMVVNTNNLGDDQALSADQVEWLTQTANESDAKWKIIQTHKAPYSNGSHYKDADVIAIREQFDSLMTALDIDFVLEGHDHTYARSEYLVNGEIETDLIKETREINGATYETAMNPQGTVYAITGTTGPKFYQPQETGLPLAYTPDIQNPVFASISVDGDYLTYTAHEMNLATQTTTIIDSFAIEKTEAKADTIAPVITGVEANGNYYIDRTVQVSDNTNIAAVTINGVPVDEKYEIPATHEAKTYTVVATDEAGNKTEVTFTMQALPTVDDIRYGAESLARIEAIQTEFAAMKHTLYGERVSFYTNLIANLTQAYEQSGIVMDNFIEQVTQLPEAEALTAADVPTVKAILAIYAEFTAEEQAVLPSEIITKIEAARLAIQVTSLTTTDGKVTATFTGAQIEMEHMDKQPYFELGTTLEAWPHSDSEQGMFTIEAYLDKIPATFTGTLQVIVDMTDFVLNENHKLFQIAADGLTAVEVPVQVTGAQQLLFETQVLGKFALIEVATVGALSTLQTLIETAEAIDPTHYTAATVAELQTAIEAAKATLNLQVPTVAQVQTSQTTLQAAIDALEEKVEIAPEVNKTELSELVQVISTVDLSAYTTASQDRLMQALATAQAVLNDEAATQKIVDETVAQLRTAFEQLVEKDSNENPLPDGETNPTPPSGTTPDNSTSPNPDENTASKLPNTGEQAVATIGGMGIVLATIGAIILRRKTKKV